MGAVAISIPKWFTDDMKILVGLKFAPSSMATHWEGLRDLDRSELRSAIARAAKESDEFPSPKMLRAYIDEHRSRPEIPEQEDRSTPALPTTFVIQATGQEIPITGFWRYFCEGCSDTGWRTLWCGPDPKTKPWLEAGSCGRRRAHGSHEFVVECPCAATNPDVQRRRAHGRETTRTKADR